MNPRSTEFRHWLLAVDKYANLHQLDLWATRIVLVAMRYGHEAAKSYAESPDICAWRDCHNSPQGRSRYCSRDCSNKNARWRHTLRQEDRTSISHPTLCYQRLLDIGLFGEDPWGVAWTEGTEPWESDPIEWLHLIIRVADGQAPPKSLPRLELPRLRLVG